MESSRSSSPAIDTAEDPLRNKRILLAEDDESARKVMAAALRALGADVVETADGGRMLVAVASYYKDGRSPDDIDLIVSDVRMPVVGGLEVFQGLRAANWTTPVILVTGYETAEVCDVAVRLGALLLPKPLDLERFERSVRSLLTRPRPPSGRAPRLQR